MITNKKISITVNYSYVEKRPKLSICNCYVLIFKVFYCAGSDDYATAHSEFLVSEEDENMASTASFSEPTWDNYHQVGININ